METATMAAASAASCAAESPNWQEELLAKLQVYHGSFVARGEQGLDYLASVDLTTTNSAGESWWDEWHDFTSFGSWPDWPVYQQIMKAAFHDGCKGAKSVSYWAWTTISPVIYSIAYILGRLAQAFLGKFLPTLQYGIIEICRFHLHLTWRQAVGEFAIVALGVATWKFVQYLRKHQYAQRTQRFIRQTSQRITKSIQSVYREIADASLLLAMALPHAAYLGIVVAFKIAFPGWVSNICTDRHGPNILKWWYPMLATIWVLHHARSITVVNSDADEKNNNKQAKTKAKGKDGKPSSKDKADKASKKKSKRRRSSIGLLLNRNKEGTSAVEYTDEEVMNDANYWLHYWLLYSVLQACYSLASKLMFVRSFLLHETFHSVSCQVEFLFYLWVFVMPEMLLILFPSAGEEERRDWSPAKQWCYECALNPVLAMPSVLKPTIIPFFEKISQAVPAAYWKRMIVDKLHYPLQAGVVFRLISESTKETLLACVEDFHTLVIPALTLLTPGFITQYGVWYVQYIVPQAYSLRALHRQHRQEKRVLYLKFWVLHGIFGMLWDSLYSFFWWFPLFTHLTFIAWCCLVLPRVINTVYGEFDRELLALGALPKVEGSTLTIQDTYTHRASSMILASLPSASDAELKKVDKDADKKDENANTDTDNPKNTDDNKLSCDDTKETVVDANDTKDTKKDDTAEETDSKSGSNTDKENQVQSRNVGRDDKKSPSVTKKSEDVAQGDSNDVRTSARLRRRSS